MKVNIFNSKILAFALCCFLLFLGINSSNNKSKAKGKNHHKQDFKISKFILLKIKKLGPNLNDINAHYQKSVKPYIETPFIPTEVDSLVEKKRPNYDNISMSSALLVGKPSSRYRKEIEVKYFH